MSIRKKVVKRHKENFQFNDTVTISIKLYIASAKVTNFALPEIVPKFNVWWSNKIWGLPDEICNATLQNCSFVSDRLDN